MNLLEAPYRRCIVRHVAVTEPSPTILPLPFHVKFDSSSLVYFGLSDVNGLLW
jgi:hypothetical protein